MKQLKTLCKKHFALLMAVLIIVLFGLNLMVGSVSIPADEVWRILTGGTPARDSWRYIVLEARLPQAVTALLTGGSLATCGLLLQTAFRNPLAGTSILGVSSGASLGVAIVMLLLGGSIATGAFTLSGFLSVLTGAFAGSMAVMGLILFFAAVLRSPVLLLIMGMMVAYVTSSLISLLNFFSTAEGVQSYMVWGLGHFGGVSLTRLPAYAGVTLVGLGGALLLVKPLNALLLGERYAASLGIRVGRVRQMLLLVTGLLTAISTAFCGPILFLDLAVPHIARLLLGTSNHHRLLPMTMLCGSAVALLCNLLCTLPGEAGLIPLNTVTPIIGAPVVIYVILRYRRGL